jgi:hypothetical protein
VTSFVLTNSKKFSSLAEALSTTWAVALRDLFLSLEQPCGWPTLLAWKIGNEEFFLLVRIVVLLHRTSFLS